MEANEALAHVLLAGIIGEEDGEFVTKTVFDKNGEPHWVTWKSKEVSTCTPELRSECANPFSFFNGPYSDKLKI
jgi:hypothetical protein